MKKIRTSDIIYRFPKFTNKSIDIMQIQAENLLNPKRYHLYKEAKKRLKWMYIIQTECDSKIAVASRKIGVSRQWLSTIHSTWKKSNYEPRKLEPESKTPKNTGNRKKINKLIEDKIVEIRQKHFWGKDKIY